jgi:MoaD family protein
MIRNKEFDKIILKIKLFSYLQELVGKREIKMKTIKEPYTIEDLINDLDGELGSNFGNLVMNKKEKMLKPEILIFLDDREIKVLQDLKTDLSDGDQIAFVPSIHGGSI